MPSDRPMPIAPMPAEDLPAAMTAYSEGLGLAWMGVLAKAGPIAELFAPFYESLSSPMNVLGFKLTELVRLAVATTTGCEACLAYRDPRALEQGMDRDVITLFDELDRADFTQREAAAIRYALTFCTNHHKIDDAMWEELKALFNDQELVTLCLYVATFLGTGRLAHAIRLVDGHCTLPGYRLSSLVEAKAAQTAA